MRFLPPGDRRRWALGGIAVATVAAVAAAAVALTDGELTRAEFIAEADEICAEANQAFEERQQDPPRTAREAVQLTDELITIAEDEREAIDDLRHPDELDDRVQRYLEAQEEGIEHLREGRDAAEAADSGRYQAAQEELAAGQRERRRLARRIGFRECSRPIDPR